jgi:hypothetical protein
MPNGAVLLLIISWPLFEVSVCLKHKQETFHVFCQGNNRLPAGGLAVVCSAETKVTIPVIFHIAAALASLAHPSHLVD